MFLRWIVALGWSFVLCYIATGWQFHWLVTLSALLIFGMKMKWSAYTWIWMSGLRRPPLSKPSKIEEKCDNTPMHTFLWRRSTLTLCTNLPVSMLPLPTLLSSIIKRATSRFSSPRSLPVREGSPYSRTPPLNRSSTIEAKLLLAQCKHDKSPQQAANE